MKEQPEFESFDQMAEVTASALVKAAAESAFRLFHDKRFRRLARLGRLPQTEQDRIFNELIVGCIVLIMLTLEAPDLRIPEELRDYFTLLEKKIPSAHVDQLRQLGVETEHLQTWKKLIDMRYKEYAKDRHDVRAASMQIASSEKRLDMNGLSRIQILVPVQAVAIGSHHHICRGKTENRDELFKVTLNALSRFYVEIRVRFEGGEITPLKRARVALKKILGFKGPKKK